MDVMRHLFLFLLATLLARPAIADLLAPEPTVVDKVFSTEGWCVLAGVFALGVIAVVIIIRRKRK